MSPPDPKIRSMKILDTTMPEMMLQDVLELAHKAFECFSTQNEIAAYVKQRMDTMYQVDRGLHARLAMAASHGGSFYFSRRGSASLARDSVDLSPM